MPNPAPPPPPRAEPANLDVLIREAMRGGSVEAVRKALAEQAPVGEVEVTEPVGLRPPDPAPLPLAERLGLLAATAATARDAPDTFAVRTSLAEVRKHLDAAEQALGPLALPAHPTLTPEKASPPPLVLPPIRHAWALALDPVPDPALVPRIAEALEVDLATARTIGAIRHTHIALRGGVAEPLERRALRLRQMTPLRATVVARAMLMNEPRALAVLGPDPDGGWRTVDLPWWEDEPDPSARPVGDVTDPGPIHLAVSGDVEMRSWRGVTDTGRWQRARYTSEQASTTRRVAVVDLHSATHILRLTDTLTDLRAPDTEEGSATRAFRAFVEALPDRFPGIHVEARRACSAPSTSGENARSSSGWPTWEEHTRVCRIHARGA